MAWATDFFAGTNAVKTSGIGGADQVYYTKKFLPALAKNLRFAALADPRPLPTGSGRSLQMYRYNRIEGTPAGTLLSEGVNPDASQFTVQELDATIAEYGQYVQITSLLEDTFIDPKVEGVIPQLGQAGATVLDLLALQQTAAGFYPLRADLDTTAEFEGTLDVVSSSTVLGDAAIYSNTDYGDADHDLNQSVLIMLDGKAAGQARAVVAYDATGGAAGDGMITVSPAFDTTPEVGDRYRVVSDDGITTGDDLSMTNIKRAVTLLRWYGAPTEGYLVGAADPFALEQLMDDSNWIDVGKYHDGEALFKGEVGKRWGVRFVEHNNPFNYDITDRGTNSTSYGPGALGVNYSMYGAVSHVQIMGMKCFSGTRLTNEAKEVDRPMMHIRKPGPQSTEQPLPRFKTAGWMARAVFKATQGLWGVNMTINNAA